MDDHVTIDLADPPHFDINEWIGTGKKYPDSHDVPLGLSDHIEGLLDLSQLDVAQCSLPRSTLRIETLLSWPIFEIRAGFVAIQPGFFFLASLPNTGEADITARPIPPLDFVKSLRGALGQALLDGKKSVQDPWYLGGRLPFWVIKFWENAHTIHSVCNAWQDSLQWLENNLGHNKPVVEATRHKLLTLRWNEPVYLSGAGTATTMTAFIRLLSYSLIDGNLIDMMFAYLSDRAE